MGGGCSIRAPPLVFGGRPGPAWKSFRVPYGESTIAAGFFRFPALAKYPVRFFFKPNAFLILFEPLLCFLLGTSPFWAGFIRVFENGQSIFGNLVLIIV